MHADEQVNQFILGKATSNVSGVTKVSRKLKGAFEAHFFEQSSFSGMYRCFAGPGMSAAGVGPQSARMILLRGALLQQDISARIGYIYRDGAMEITLPMAGEFLRDADLAVLLIYQDNHFIRVGRLAVYDKGSH